jgi:hypothetical protein
MPRIEVDIDDKGEIVGQSPAELEALFKRTDAAAHGRGYSKGMSEAAESAKKQIADTVAAELAKRDALVPLEKEKYARIDEENASLKKQVLETSSQADRALKAREESHAREILNRSDALTKREGEIRDLVKSTMRADAIAAGAREESLAELDVIFASHIGFDDDMKAFVKGDDGRQATAHGKPITIAAHVKEYLDTHPHHRRPASGQGGGARGGASFSGSAGQVPTADAATARIQGGDRSPGAIDELYKATRPPV